MRKNPKEGGNDCGEKSSGGGEFRPGRERFRRLKERVSKGWLNNEKYFQVKTGE